MNEPPAQPNFEEDVNLAGVVVGPGDPPAEDDRLANRDFNLRGRTLREHAARGTLINTGWLVGLSFLTLMRGFVLAAFLTRDDYGVFGAVTISLGVVLTLKHVGVSDKYVQQEEADQELAFQKAWTLEAMMTGIMIVLLLVTAPVIAIIYGEPKLLAPALVSVLALPAGLLQMPVFVYYRRMEFARQRLLQSVEPIVAFAVMIVLAIAGAGYWALFTGVIAGAYVAGIVAILNSPYKLRLRYDRGTLNSYWTFSWPLLVAAGSGMLIAQTAVLAANIKLGLSGVGTLTLAANITQLTDRVDRLITGSLYPAICAMKDRTDLLFESFVKSNRLALMWAAPFGFALTLFSSDLVQFGIGERWRPTVILLQVYGATAAVGHVAFNWDAYLRARGDTRPMAIATSAAAVTFLATAIPLLFIDGLRGFAIGVAIQAMVHLGFRVYFLSRLFHSFQFVTHASRALLPTVPAIVLVILLRTAESGPRSATMALAELTVYSITFLAATWRLERGLLREVLGYLRARPAPST